jgi:hypothetical protein
MAKPEHEPLILQYTNLLHQYQGPEAQEVRNFLKEHEKNQIFVERARKLNALYVLNKSLLPS